MPTMGSVRVFLGNAEEFSFSYRDIITSCILLFAIAFIVFSVILFLVGAKIRVLITSLTISLTFGLYTQGNWINADYGLLNGNKINWNDYKIYNIINIAFWIFIIILPFLLLLILKREKWTTLITRVLNIFVVFLVVSFIAIAISYGSVNNSVAHSVVM